MRKKILAILLSLLFFINHQSAVEALLITPGPIKIKFEKITTTSNLIIEEPASGYFKVKGITKFNNIYIYSTDTDYAYLDLRKLPLDFQNYPLHIKTSSDKLEVCLLDKEWTCGSDINSSLNNSKRITISINDEVKSKLEKDLKGDNYEKIEDFDINVSINKKDFLIKGAISYNPHGTQVAMPYDYYEKVDNISLFTLVKYGFIFFAITIWAHKLDVILFNLKNSQQKWINKSGFGYFLLQMSALVLAIFLSSIILKSTHDPTPYFGCFGTDYKTYEIHGLPVPYKFINSGNGYQTNLVFMSINYWFWLALFLYLIQLFKRNESAAGGFKYFLKQNKLFITTSITIYIFYILINNLFGLTILC